MAIADGTYELLSLLDVKMAMDVISNSTANKANVRLWGRNGSNGQKWDIANATGYVTIRDAETGKSLDVANGTQAKGTNVWMYNFNNSAAQHWVLTEYGTTEINGYAYPVVRIGAFGASTYVLDAAGGKATINTNVQIWTSNGTDAQRWVLVPAEWEISYTSDGGSVAPFPVATRGGCGTEVGTLLPSVTALQSGSVYPAWLGPLNANGEYQIRYRTRTRSAGYDYIGDWTNWKSIADGSTYWDGWGTPGQPNTTAQLVSGMCWCDDSIAIDNSATYDRTDVEISVRTWSNRWRYARAAHGGAYTYQVTTVRPVSITDVSLLLSPDGVTVVWATNATRGGNAITFASDVWGTYSLVGDASGSVTIPQYLLRHMPAEGETVRVTMTMRTVDGLDLSHEATATASYEGTHGTGLTLRADVDGSLATVTASNANARAWLVVAEGHGTRFVPLAGNGSWVVPAPLGVPWRVLASVVTGGTWASIIQQFSPILDAGWHVTSQDLTRDLAIYTGEGSAPKADPKYSRSVTSVDVAGRERPVYVPADATESSWTLDGITYGQWLDGDVALADWAVHAGHVYFRSPQGFWSQACVTGGTVEQTRTNMRAINISMQGEVW